MSHDFWTFVLSECTLFLAVLLTIKLLLLTQIRHWGHSMWHLRPNFFISSSKSSYSKTAPTNYNMPALSCFSIDNFITKIFPKTIVGYSCQQKVYKIFKCNDMSSLSLLLLGQATQLWMLAWIYLSSLSYHHVNYSAPIIHSLHFTSIDASPISHPPWQLTQDSDC